MYEAIRDGEDLGQVLNRLAQAGHTNPGADIFCGALDQLVRVYGNARSAGVAKPKTSSKELQRFLELSPVSMSVELGTSILARDDQRLEEQVSALATMVHSCRRYIKSVELPA